MNQDCVRAGLAYESVKYQYGVFQNTLSSNANCSLELFQNKALSFTAGRRDWIAFQVMLDYSCDCTVSVGGRPVFSPRGNLDGIRLAVTLEDFPEGSVSLNLVGLTEDDDRCLKADLLLNDDACFLEKGRVQPVWVNIDIPEDMKPGKYKGKVEIFRQFMFMDEERLESLEFDITVKEVTLPAPKDYRFYLDLWQHNSNIARKHEVRLWSDEHFEVMKYYVESLARLGQKAVTIIASEIPWSGQTCFRVKNYPSDLFEYNIVNIEKGLDGKFTYDFSKMGRYIELCFKGGIDGEIEVFGLINIWRCDEEGYGKVTEDYPDAIRLRYYDRNEACYKYMKLKSEIGEYVKALEKFFVEKGWIDKVRIVADEPGNMELYREVLDFLKASAPSFRYKTAINHVEFIEESKNRIDDFVPSVMTVAKELENINRIRQETAGRFLWYVCCGPAYPNTFIRSNLLESRLIGYLTAYMRFDGFLRWNYTVWPEKPRERMSYNYPIFAAGDTNFVYPANNGRPLLSLRYMNLRRGIADFELISILREKHPDAGRILDRVWDKLLRQRDISTFYSEGARPENLYSLNYTDYEEARTILLEELEKLA